MKICPLDSRLTMCSLGEKKSKLINLVYKQQTYKFVHDNKGNISVHFCRIRCMVSKFNTLREKYLLILTLWFVNNLSKPHHFGF